MMLGHWLQSLRRSLLPSSLRSNIGASENALKSTQEHARNRSRSALDSLFPPDPLDPIERVRGWRVAKPNPFHKDVSDFPLYEAQIEESEKKVVMDEAIKVHHVSSVMDDGAGEPSMSMGAGALSSYAVPEMLQNWYLSQGFIGYQACAIIAQHWLVDKACSMVGEDAVRHGWTLNAASGDIIDDETHNVIQNYDVAFKVKENLKEFDKFKNVFGIRILLFEIESEDEEYYQKPFNIDGITPGSYKGISQVDPYWMMPMLTAESTSDPSSQHFYEPQYWIISGRRYHRSHLIIARGPIPADILKPTYIFGGVPLTQRIYERVYAAERTANESPLLSLNKRTTAIHVDLDKAISNQKSFEERIMFWVQYRDNHAVKVLGIDETMEQFDTSLADFDNVIMNQYQLVAAIAKTPSTKLLGTPPKGFNATGEFEMISYNEEQESIQENVMTPVLNRHYMILMRSLGKNIGINVVWEPVDSITKVQQAELNSKKSQTDKEYVTMGAISPDEVRTKLRDDPHSGYGRLTDEDAEDQPGYSPENLAALGKSGAAVVTAEARKQTSTAQVAQITGEAPEATSETPVSSAGEEPQQQTQQPVAESKMPMRGGGERYVRMPERPAGESPRADYVPGQQPTVIREPGITESASVASLLDAVAKLLGKIDDHLVPEGQYPHPDQLDATYRGTKPGTNRSVEPTVGGIGQVTPQMEPYKLPKMKVGGMVIAIENPRGSIRKGTNLQTGDWEAKMPHHYGFIKGIKGADGDELDAFVGPNLKSQKVFVINQNDPMSGEFDEHKSMIGFDTIEEAKKAYQDAFSPGWTGMGDAYEMTMDQFKTWMEMNREKGCNSPLNEACIAQTTSAGPLMTG